ncbi:MAG TPA: TrbI/VirB10 family protein [Verrucomicrobiae bacterium]|nr:TrbI/VirB10 family protein [Verrucomicrobiae bacterium]
MKPRDFLEFFKTKSGKLVVFAALFAGGLIIFGVLRKQHSPDQAGIAVASFSTNVIGKPQVVESVQLPLEAYHPPSPMPSSRSTSRSSAIATNAAPAVPVPLPNVSVQPAQFPAPIGLFADSAAGAPQPRKLGAVYAPFGRLIPCETIITVDSSSMETPIIGLVTENIYFGGRLIIPAGTEVHGMAQTDRQRDRIATSTSWTFVWQDGQELQLKAIALDREFDNNTNQSGWGITDGSAGLRGQILKSDNLADIKLFAATFLSGAADALTEKQQTIFGPINTPSLNNAPFQGVQAVLQTYAQQIYDSIQKNGFYVRVPSGKQFYLYVLQTIDRADATFGGTGLSQNQSTKP